MHTKDHILKASLNLFFSFGIQNISMDDIANKCGISKKTIYKHYENKSDLVDQTIRLLVEELKANLKVTRRTSENALEELYTFLEYLNSISFEISPVYGKDLKKYYPNKYIEIFEYKNHIIIPFVLRNIENGIAEGLYKSDINAQQICDAFDNISKIIFTSDLSFNAFTNKNAVSFLNSLFMHRLVSIKGLEVLHQLNEIV
ncbi:TetR/AcrR family transcriptional regulator [Winogradskyella sp. PC D3.3]